MNIPASTVVKNQKKTFGPVYYTEHNTKYRITATVRFDDQCSNGQNSFSITGEIREGYKVGEETHWREYSGGCIHGDIAKHFPELAPYIKWHLCDTRGPMHYIANTVYPAGDRDHRGLRKGEFRQHTSRGPHQNGGIEGVPCWELKTPKQTQKYSHDKPSPVLLTWEPYGIIGEGKERQLDSARRAAIWPDATDDELCSDKPVLTKLLEARLPKLQQEFYQAMISLGFNW